MIYLIYRMLSLGIDLVKLLAEYWHMSMPDSEMTPDLHEC